MVSPLTERQQQVNRFIREYYDAHGFGPTVREIGDQMGISSPNGVICHLRALQSKGAIHVEPFTPRGIVPARLIGEVRCPKCNHVIEAELT